MRKYNRRILTALVVAYKKGIINRKPLNRWLKFNEVFYRSMKYIAYIILFTFIFIILDQKIYQYFNLDENLYIGGRIIQKSRFISGFIIGVIAFNLYRLYKYISQVYTVKKAMKKYKTTDDDVEILDKITFKINV